MANVRISALSAAAALASVDTLVVVQAGETKKATVGNVLDLASAATGNAVSVETANRISADNALSQAISIVSQTLSVETASRVAADNTLSQGISVVSQALSVEIANRISADNALSNSISAVSEQLSLRASALSQAISVVSQALSIETADRISAVNAVSQSLSAMSNRLSNLSDRVSVLEAAPGGGSVTSAELDAVSAQAASIVSVETAARVAGDNTLSQAISVVSQALSVETANRVSGDAALSARVDSVVTSVTMGNVRMQSIFELSEIAEPVAPLSDVVRLYAVDDQGHTRLQYKLPDDTKIQVARDNVWVCKNLQGSNITKGQVVFFSGGVGASGTAEVKLARADSLATMPAAGVVFQSVISVNAFGRILIIGKLESADTTAASEGDRIFVSPTTAGAFTSVEPVSPDFSQRLGIVINSHASDGTLAVVPTGIHAPDLTSAVNLVSNTLSEETASRISADNVLSAAINVVSNVVSVEIVDRASAVNVVSQALSVMSNRLSNLSDRVSVLEAAPPGAASTTSNELSNLLSDVRSDMRSAISVETSNRVSADNALSNLISILSVELSLRASTLAQGISVVSQALSVEIINRISADNVLSTAISVVSQQLSLQVSALSQAISVVSQALSVETADRISAVNVVSQSLSAMSNRLSNLSDRVSILEQTPGGGSVTSAEVQAVSSQAASIVSVLSADVSVRASALAQAISVVSQALSVEIADRVSADNALSNLISILSVALSQRASGLSQAISVVSNAVSIVSQALSVEIANRVSADNALSNLISILSVALSDRASVLSHAISVEVSNRISAVNVVSQALSVMSNRLSNLSDRVSILEQTPGGGSVTSTELSAVSAAAASALQTLSALVSNAQSAGDAVSADIVSFKADNVSQHAALSVRIDGAGGGPFLNTQFRMMSTDQSDSGSALVALSGLILTVAQDETWKFEGMILLSTSVIGAGIRLGTDVPPLSTPRFIRFLGASAGQSAGMKGAAGLLQVSGQSANYSTLTIGGAGAVIPVWFHGLFNVASGGNFQMMAAGIASTAQSPLTIMAGSHFVAYRIK